MNIESFQDTLFEDPIGLRFRHAREKARWSLESVAQQLKLPVAVLEAIEREDWARLGAPIFARSYVGSYAKILGLPASLADDVVRGKPVPQLVTIGTGSPTRRAVDRGVMNLAYLAMTILIVGSLVMLAMYFQSPRRSAEMLPLDSPAIGAGESSGMIGPAVSAADQAGAGAAVVQSPPTSGKESGAPGTTAAPISDNTVMASLAPSLSERPAPLGSDLVLRFRGESWVDLVDQAGTHLERGLVPAGAERRFAAGQLAYVTLGDSTAVDVDFGSAAIDLAPYSEANVARFTVSSDGRIFPVAAD